MTRPCKEQLSDYDDYDYDHDNDIDDAANDVDDEEEKEEKILEGAHSFSFVMIKVSLDLARSALSRRCFLSRLSFTAAT